MKLPRRPLSYQFGDWTVRQRAGGAGAGTWDVFVASVHMYTGTRAQCLEYVWHQVPTALRSAWEVE